MDLKNIHKLLVYSFLAIFLYVILPFVGRILAGVTFHEYVPWLVFAIQIIVVLLLLHINQEHRFIMKRTVLPGAFFLLLTASNPGLYNNLAGNISALIFAWCLILTLKTYHNPQSQSASFHVAFLLALGGLFCWQPMLFFIPLFWIGFHRFRAFNGKSFAASLMGVIVVYLFLAAWYLHINDWPLFFEKLPQLGEMFEIQWIDWSWADWAFGGFILLLLVFTAIELFVSGFSEKVKTTSFFNYIYLITGILFVFAFFLDNSKDNILPVIYIPVSFVAGYYFTVLDNNKWVTYLLFLTISVIVGYYVFHLY